MDFWRFDWLEFLIYTLMKTTTKQRFVDNLSYSNTVLSFIFDCFCFFFIVRCLNYLIKKKTIAPLHSIFPYLTDLIWKDINISRRKQLSVFTKYCLILHLCRTIAFGSVMTANTQIRIRQTHNSTTRAPSYALTLVFRSVLIITNAL